MNWGLIFTSVLICAGCCAAVSVAVIAVYKYMSDSYKIGFRHGFDAKGRSYYTCFDNTMKKVAESRILHDTVISKCREIFSQEVEQLYKER